jgi:hypothetical protein
MCRMAFIEHSNMASADSANRVALAADDNMYVLLILVAPRNITKRPIRQMQTLLLF